MGLSLNDLTDAPRAHAVLGSQLDLVPGSTAQVVQPEGTLAGADEHIPPFLCVVHRILQHKPCRITQHVKSWSELELKKEMKGCAESLLLLPLHLLDTRGQQETTSCSSLRLLAQRHCFPPLFADLVQLIARG